MSEACMMIGRGGSKYVQYMIRCTLLGQRCLAVPLDCLGEAAGIDVRRRRVDGGVWRAQTAAIVVR